MFSLSCHSMPRASGDTGARHVLSGGQYARTEDRDQGEEVLSGADVESLAFSAPGTELAKRYEPKWCDQPWHCHMRLWLSEVKA
jgi:hypothetical protein